MSLDKLVPVVRLTDMSEEMVKEVIEVTRVAIDRSSTVWMLGIYINVRINKYQRISRTIFVHVIMVLGIAWWVVTLVHL